MWNFLQGDVSMGERGAGGSGCTNVRVRIPERQIAGMGKITRRRSVKTFKLPRLTRGTNETRHCAIIATLLLGINTQIKHEKMVVGPGKEKKTHVLDLVSPALEN